MAKSKCPVPPVPKRPKAPKGKMVVTGQSGVSEISEPLVRELTDDEVARPVPQPPPEEGCTPFEFRFTEELPMSKVGEILEPHHMALKNFGLLYSVIVRLDNGVWRPVSPYISEKDICHVLSARLMILLLERGFVLDGNLVTKNAKGWVLPEVLLSELVEVFAVMKERGMLR